jgi:hypothetical protein
MSTIWVTAIGWYTQIQVLSSGWRFNSKLYNIISQPKKRRVLAYPNRSFTVFCSDLQIIKYWSKFTNSKFKFVIYQNWKLYTGKKLFQIRDDGSGMTVDRSNRVGRLRLHTGSPYWLCVHTSSRSKAHLSGRSVGETRKEKSTAVHFYTPSCL